MYDIVACEYGLTPVDFLEGFTPRQLQMTIKMLQERTHNNKALEINLHGGDVKYIDSEAQEMMRIMEARQNGSN